jgi:hypothetical protein
MALLSQAITWLEMDGEYEDINFHNDYANWDHLPRPAYL